MINDEMYYPEVIDQTEKTVITINNEEIEVDVTDELFNISEEEINSSLYALNTQKCNAKKKTAKQISEELVSDFLATRSDESWKNLQEYFWFGIRQFAYKYTNNWEDAYDMTIETFIRAYEAIDSYDSEKAAFSTWLWTICRNNCLYYIKQNSKLTVVDNDISDIFDSELPTRAATSNTHDNTNYSVNNTGDIIEISAEDVYTRLYNISINEMSNIGGVSGEILKMKLIDNFKIREIADKLNMNESTVKNHLYRSKENLARILKINHRDLYQLYIDANSQKDDEYVCG